MNTKLQIAKQSSSKPIYILLVALSAFNLGRYSEHFSGSGWAWLALVGNVLLLLWLLFSLVSDYRKTRPEATADDGAPLSRPEHIKKVAEASLNDCGRTTSTSSISIASIPTCRWKTLQAPSKTHSRGKGPSLRPVRGRRGQYPPRSCGTADHSHPDRILVHRAGA